MVVVILLDVVENKDPYAFGVLVVCNRIKVDNSMVYNHNYHNYLLVVEDLGTCWLLRYSRIDNLDKSKHFASYPIQI
jgi:hypothetical protein